MLADTLLSVKDQVVCISGSSRGLGKGLAAMFAQRGANVVISSWNADELAAAKSELAADGLTVTTIVADVSCAAACAELVQKTASKFGRIDTMICNAGIDNIKPAEQYENEEWDAILDVNLKGAFFCAKAAGLAMLTLNQGSIILTSSIAGSSGIPGLVPYAASKGGIDQITRTLAVEWAKRGVRVNAVAPGYINNFMDGVEPVADSPYQARAIARTPMGRRGDISEIGGAYLFLSSRASSYMTGSIVYVDGGYHAG